MKLREKQLQDLIAYPEPLPPTIATLCPDGMTKLRPSKMGCPGYAK